MPDEFTALFERDDAWHIAYFPEIPGANGQGRTQEAARESLGAAIARILPPAGMIRTSPMPDTRPAPDDSEAESLRFIAKIEEGLRQSDARQLVAHDEIKKTFLDQLQR